MRQIWIPRFGDTSVLEVREAPDPEPGPGEVRVRVEGAGVNFADLSARMGTYQDCPPPPVVVGYEYAGTVEKLGDGVDAGWQGAAVFGMKSFGCYSTHLVLPVSQLVRRPEGMDAVTGAAIPVVYVTAWMILEIMGRVRAGDRVLVHSAGGGVGLAALDLIKRRGATAIGTASPGKHEFLRQRGYDELYGYDVDLRAKLKDSCDLVMDPVGGASWGVGLDVLKPGGRLCCFGFSAQSQGEKRSVFTSLSAITSVPWLKLMPIALINANKGVLGVNMGRMAKQPEVLLQWMVELGELWKKGEIRPLVHASVPFDNPAEAHRILHARENIGKVILVP